MLTTLVVSRLPDKSRGAFCNLINNNGVGEKGTDLGAYFASPGCVLAHFRTTLCCLGIVNRSTIPR
jgi:hypothetical protein